MPGITATAAPLEMVQPDLPAAWDQLRSLLEMDGATALPSPIHSLGSRTSSSGAESKSAGSELRDYVLHGDKRVRVEL